jgi:hypothetical protein
MIYSQSTVNFGVVLLSTNLPIIRETQLKILNTAHEVVQVFRVDSDTNDVPEWVRTDIKTNLIESKPSYKESLTTFIIVTGKINCDRARQELGIPV